MKAQNPWALRCPSCGNESCNHVKMEFWVADGGGCLSIHESSSEEVLPDYPCRCGACGFTRTARDFWREAGRVKACSKRKNKRATSRKKGQ